jgi:hypothetical protein
MADDPAAPPVESADEQVDPTAAAVPEESRQPEATAAGRTIGANKIAPAPPAGAVHVQPSHAPPLLLSIVLTLLTGVVTCGSVLMFTGPGWGARIFGLLSKHPEWSFWLCSAAAGLLLVLYVLDFSYWQGRWRRAKRLLLLIFAGLLALGTLFSANKYPAAPLGLYLCAVPVYFYAVRRGLFPAPRYSDAAFLHAMGTALGVNCAVTLFGWFGWVLSGNWYSDSLSQKYALDMGCHVVSKCLAGYLMWFAPFIIAVCCFVFAVVSGEPPATVNLLS